MGDEYRDSDSISSPASPLSEIEGHPDAVSISVLQPSIREAFKEVKSFKGNTFWPIVIEIYAVALSYNGISFQIEV